MAKMMNSKSEMKKLQKEIAVLKNKLKTAEKHSTLSEKNWKKEQVSSKKEMEKKLVLAFQKGYDAALAESHKKEMARKKAIQTAEVSFERDYRKAEKKASATKISAKSTRGRKAKKVTQARGKAASAPMTKAKKEVKAESNRLQAKKRGRPAKASQKMERLRGNENHQFAHHNEIASSNNRLAPQHHESEIN